jgi:Fe2+ or Zn2+ uptake regulation protein
MEHAVSEGVWGRLRARGLRRTPQREAIIEALEAAGDALPLPVLLARGRRRAPGLGERTAERTVALLVEAGAVDAITRPGGDCDVTAWARDQAERQGFEIEGHDVTVHGRCRECRAA